MHPKERQDKGRKDLFRACLDQIVDGSLPLAKRAETIDGCFLAPRSVKVKSTLRRDRRCRRDGCRAS